MSHSQLDGGRVGRIGDLSADPLGDRGFECIAQTDKGFECVA